MINLPFVYNIISLLKVQFRVSWHLPHKFNLQDTLLKFTVVDDADVLILIPSIARIVAIVAIPPASSTISI